MVAWTIKVGVVMCCYHLGVCCEGHVLLQPQNGCVVKGIREAFIDYNKVSTHMIKAAEHQPHSHNYYCCHGYRKEHHHTNYNCDPILENHTFGHIGQFSFL